MTYELRVYVLDAQRIKGDIRSLKTEDMQDMAEARGRVYSLVDFQEAFNVGDISSDNDFIFFVADGIVVNRSRKERGK